MKRIIVSTLSILIMLVTLLSLPTFISFAEGDNITLVSDEIEIDYYGRDILSRLSHADAYLYAYDAICEGVERCEEQIEIYDTKPVLSESQFKMVLDAYRRDHAEHFWLGTQNKYTYTNSSGVNYIHSFIPSYTMTGDELTEAKERFEEEITSILVGITPEMSEFEKELYLHDTLAKRIEYVLDAPNAHDAYGALVDGKAVCEGYAESLQCLLQRVGIQSFLALGAGINPSTGEGEPHEWNYVRLDGNYYHVDLTWADQGERIYHAYFNQTDDTILVDHTIDNTAYDLPKCSSADAFYFNVMGGSFPTYTVEEIGAHLKSHNLKTNIYIPTGAKAFITWLQSNILDIASTAGVNGRFTYSYANLGNEVLIFINDCKHAFDQLTLIDEDEATCLESGNIKHYLCECGNLYSYSFNIVGQFSGELLTKSDVIVPAKGHDYIEMLEDAAHLHTEGDCQTHPIFWYDCSRCDSNAKNDANATDFLYTALGLGDHNISDEWSNSDEKHFKKCLVTGCDYSTDGEDCYGGEASCFKLAECEVCGAKHGTTLPHAFFGDLVKDAAGHACSCITPGCTAHDTLLHHRSSGEATETNAEVCVECGYIITPALSHDAHTPKSEWKCDEAGHWKECTGCEGQKLDYSKHDYDNSCDALCETCGKERDITHSPDKNWLTDDSTHWHTCPCGKEHGRTNHEDENGDNRCDVCSYSLSTDSTVLFDFSGEKWIILGYATEPAPVLIALAICVGLILLAILFRKRH